MASHLGSARVSSRRAQTKSAKGKKPRAAQKGSKASVGVEKSAMASAKIGDSRKNHDNSAPATPHHVNTPQKTKAKASRPMPAVINTPQWVVDTRRSLGVTQDVFARMVGVTTRSVAGWESGRQINESSLRRIKEMRRLRAELGKVMEPDFIPKWLVSPVEGLGGMSPVQALEHGETDRMWRAVFLLGSGLPL